MIARHKPRLILHTSPPHCGAVCLAQALKPCPDGAHAAPFSRLVCPDDPAGCFEALLAARHEPGQAPLVAVLPHIARPADHQGALARLQERFELRLSLFLLPAELWLEAHYAEQVLSGARRQQVAEHRRTELEAGRPGDDDLARQWTELLGTENVLIRTLDHKLCAAELLQTFLEAHELPADSVSMPTDPAPVVGSPWHVDTIEMARLTGIGDLIGLQRQILIDSLLQWQQRQRPETEAPDDPTEFIQQWLEPLLTILFQRWFDPDEPAPEAQATALRSPLKAEIQALEDELCRLRQPLETPSGTLKLLARCLLGKH